MAVGDTTQLTALLTDLFDPSFKEAVERSNFLMERIRHTTGSDLQYKWQVHHAGNQSASSYAEHDIMPTPGVQSYAEAEIPYRMQWIVYGNTGLIEAATKGQGGYFESLASEASEASEDLKNHINDQFLATTKAKATDIDGIGVIVSDSGTYAGIDRATNVYWQSVVEDNSGVERDLSIELMQKVWNPLHQPLRRAKTSSILGSFNHFDDYGNLLAVYRRFNGTETLDGGYPALRFNNIPFVGVEGMADGDIYFLDESEFKYEVLKNYETAEKDLQTDGRKFMITHYGALICEHSGRQGRITDLRTS